MEKTEKEESGYGLALFFLSMDDALNMAEKVMQNDKKWRINGIEFVKKEVLDKTIQLTAEKEKNQRNSKILIGEESRLKIRKMIAEEKYPPIL